MSQKHSRQFTIQRCHSQLYISARCRPYHFKFFKGCRPQILLGPFLNTLTYLQLRTKQVSLRYKTDLQHKLRERCPYSEFFWSVFSYIRTEFGKIRSISPYSIQMLENTNQKNSEYRHFSRSDMWQSFHNDDSAWYSIRCCNDNRFHISFTIYSIFKFSQVMAFFEII